MSNLISIREMQSSDIPALEIVLDRTELFPSEMLRPMAEPYFKGQSQHHWLVAVDGQRPVGFAYVEPERMTEGTFNLLAIAVEPSVQRHGIGKAIVNDLLRRLSAQEGRVLLVETSSFDEYASTRAFYEGQAFAREALIRDFYRDGEDKLIYWKKI